MWLELFINFNFLFYSQAACTPLASSIMSDMFTEVSIPIAWVFIGSFFI